jgi:hypothetical protein
MITAPSAPCVPAPASILRSFQATIELRSHAFFSNHQTLFSVSGLALHFLVVRKVLRDLPDLRFWRGVRYVAYRFAEFLINNSACLGRMKNRLANHYI